MSIALRTVTTSDAALLRDLAAANPPLDVHTPYSYWVMCHAGRQLSFVAEHEGGEAVGFVTALPVDADTVFLWQVGVDASQRGRSIGRRLLEAVRSAALERGHRRLQVTIEDGNQASLRLFSGVFGHALQPSGHVEFEPGVVAEIIYETPLVRSG